MSQHPSLAMARLSASCIIIEAHRPGFCSWMAGKRVKMKISIFVYINLYFYEPPPDVYFCRSGFSVFYLCGPGVVRGKRAIGCPPVYAAGPDRAFAFFVSWIFRGWHRLVLDDCAGSAGVGRDTFYAPSLSNAQGAYRAPGTDR